MKTIIKIIHDYKVIEYDKCNIYIIENLLEEKFCNKIIELIDTTPFTKTVIEPFNNVECFVASTNEIYDYDFSKFINEEYISLLNDNMNISNSLNYNINEKVKLISKIMENVNCNICFEYNTGYQLRKIYGRTKPHVDGLINILNSNVTFIDKSLEIEHYKMVRNSSIIFSLNDDYDGGVYHFPYHDIQFKMKKGSVIIFPPYWTHPHEVSSVENNTYRYTINTWTLELLNS
jgi:hypothetical protein